MSKKPFSIPTTVEAQIRTRARNLPVYKCYVSKEWEKLQLASIMIIRKHTNGNITMGNFKVELKLRGITNCTYSFNESPLRLDEILENYPDMYVECDYILAHNIIYAGWEFAKDYGFEPHRNFKTAQYILEEDTDDIPMIDIPLGYKGIPVLEVPYGESGEREMAILNKTAGDDYRVAFINKDGTPILKERPYMDVLDEAIKTGFDGFIEKYSGSDSFKEYQVITDLIYIAKVFTDDEKTQIDVEVDHIFKDPRLQSSHDDSEKDYEEELELSIQYFEEGKTDKADAEFRKVIDRHPDDSSLWGIFLHNLSIDSDCVEEAVTEAYSLFPNDPVIKAWYAEWLAQENRSDEIFALFNQAPGLDALTKDDVYISATAIPPFCYAYAVAWLDKGDILRAEPYYQMIVRLGLDYRLADFVQETMIELKRKKLNEMFDAGMFGDDEAGETEK